ncbi:hypothetical protein [Allosalinactinospora lopnorensis]|uniref:hypothetical protein n=1 Tax=Allosalinactinospora lopnorensis TaxID=1352348 RepID=UPI000623EA94|nr:hypothetical protein [Allosalinactinospora lopnorensis]
MRTNKTAVTYIAAAAAGGAVAWYRMRSHTGQATVRHSATVLADESDVLAAWREDGRVPGLLAKAAPTTEETAPARPVAGDTGLTLRVLVSPAPGERGTEIRVTAEGPGARRQSGRLREDVRRLKSILECGEAVTVEGQPSARGSLNERLQNRIQIALRRGGRG